MNQPEDESPKPPPNRQILPPETVNFLSAYWAEAQQILLHPREFFTTMPTEGGLKTPLIFLAVSAAANSLMTALISINPTTIPITFLSTMVGVSIISMVAATMSQALGGKGSYEATFRIFAYGAVTLLFAWIPVLGLVATLYTCVLNFFGLKVVHQLSDGKAILVVILSGILTAIIVGLGACTIMLRNIFHM